VAALRRALTLLALEPVPGARVALWVGEPPSPWPFADVPAPEGTWMLSRYVGMPRGVHGGDRWAMHLRLPDPQAEAARLSTLLTQQGWTPLSEQAQPQAWGLQFGASSRTETVLCRTAPETRSLTLQADAHTGHLALEQIQDAGPCAAAFSGPEPRALDVVLPFPDPNALPAWVLPTQDGLGQQALVWVSRSPEAVMEGLAASLQEQGWTITDRGSLVTNVQWLLAHREDRGTPRTIQIWLLPVAKGQLWVFFRIA